ncbi:MAG: TRAP transporter large permease subunit [Alphaproteobacteria bacterium]|nr:TRAP transporter large permease subunit [Alphaproteobacteria bacterium]
MDFEALLPLLMFAALGILLFSGFPVAFILGGVAIGFGYIAYWYDDFLFEPLMFFNVVSRIWGGVAESPILTAIPMFIFMGTMLERSGVASDLLHALQVLLRRVPGGLAMSVTLMGTIMAATTGIIGASVVMMTLLALPVMLERRYHPALACGTIAASGTLGILIPPSIMLVIMADLLAKSVGNLFVAAVVPGFMLSVLYLLYIYFFSHLRPDWAPPLPDDEGPQDTREIMKMVLKSFLPPIFLIVLVLGSILGGIATPTEAAGVGGLGALLLALINGKLKFHVLRDVIERAALTGGMLFMIFLGATAFAYVFRALGGDDIVVDIVEGLGFGSWGVLIVLLTIVFLLGFFFDWLEITLIVIPVFTPVIELLDFGDHVPKADIVYWFAILMAVNLQTSFLTPPFGFALFYMKGVAPPEVKINHIYTGIVPFVCLQLVALGLVVAFPNLALWLPNTLLN